MIDLGSINLKICQLSLKAEFANFVFSRDEAYKISDESLGKMRVCGPLNLSHNTKMALITLFTYDIIQLSLLVCCSGLFSWIKQHVFISNFDESFLDLFVSNIKIG